MNKFAKFWISKSEAAKSAIVFTFAILLSRGILFISTPIFTRIMPSDQIGVVGLFSSYLCIISSISSLALNSGGFMVGLKEFTDKRDEYISSILTLTSLSAGLLFVVFIFAPSFWSDLLGLPFGLIILLLFGCYVTPAYEFWLMRQRYEYKYKKAAIITILTSVISTALGVIAVLIAKGFTEQLGEIRLYVATGSSLLVYFIIWLFLIFKGKSYFKKEYWSFSLVLSLPLLGHSFASQMLSVSDRFFISKFIDNSAVGIYSTLYSVGSITLMLWGALNSSFVPYLFQNLDTEQQKKEVAINAAKLLGGFSLLTFIVALMAPEIVYILAPREYHRYVYIVPPIIVGVYFISVGNFYSNLLVYCKNTLSIMFSSIIAGVVSVVLNILLIPKYGFVAAAYNTMLSYIVFALLQAFFSYYLFKKKHSGKFAYNNNIMIFLSTLTIILNMVCVLLYKNDTLRYFIILLIIPILFFVYKNRRKYVEVY